MIQCIFILISMYLNVEIYVFSYFQIFEWYREGACGGGFYKLTATILDGNGKVCCIILSQDVALYEAHDDGIRTNT